MLAFSKNVSSLLFIILAVQLIVCKATNDDNNSISEIVKNESPSPTSLEDFLQLDATFESPVSTMETTDQTLLIHFISDLQYNILPVNGEMDLCQVTSGVITEEGCFGGYGRLATYMDDNKGDTDIWLNAGNMLKGSLFGILKFEPIIEAMNSLQFDAVAADPEMFTYGIEAAEQIYMEGLNDILVSFNYKEQSTKQIQKGDCKIAVVGFVDKGKTDAIGVTNLTLQDEIEYITNEVGRLVAGNNDIIIVMGSTSKDKALEMANIEGVDLVIYSGADASDFPPDYDYLWNNTQRSNGENVSIASLKIDATEPDSFFMVGEIYLTVTNECKVSDATFNGTSYYGELDFNESFLDTTVNLLEDMQRVVAKTPVTLTGADSVCQLGECLLGNMVTDAVMAAVAGSQPPVAFSVFPTWTLFTNISLTGDVSVADLHELFEDDSYVYSIMLSGQQLKKMFEEAVSDYKSPNEPMENFLQVSNYLRVTYNLKKKPGERVHEIQIFDISNPRELQSVNFDEATSKYHIAIPKFILEGEHFSFIESESLSLKFYEFTFLDALKDYMSWKSSLQNSTIPVVPTVGERIKYYEGTSSSEETCYNNTGEVVIITLGIIAVLSGAVFVIWKFLYPKFRARRGSTVALII